MFTYGSVSKLVAFLKKNKIHIWRNILFLKHRLILIFSENIWFIPYKYLQTYANGVSMNEYRILIMSDGHIFFVDLIHFSFKNLYFFNGSRLYTIYLLVDIKRRNGKLNFVFLLQFNSPHVHPT